MNEASPPSDDLPEAIEDEVLAILDGDDSAQETALRDLLESHPEHARTIRAWLGRAGIPLPAIITTGGSVVEGEDLDTLPARLGRYVLTQRVGRGGFGTVYRADQLEPFQRTVAIKVLNPGMDSREILARFSAEREALNRMDHPGIARLHDAGTTPIGRPFFVMELVAGPSLATYCRQQSLPLRERIELFLLVLDAMQHAHQKAVVHRDLSSNNVLVTEVDGQLQPKVIDFGIAKSLADPLLAGGAMTFQGTLLGTPEFMSPEQAAGDSGDIDTRADVYALGVQLYELLTDQLPVPSHVLRAQGIAGMARAIRDHVARPPSAVAVGPSRNGLRGDLDAITMRAIRKRRNERYAGVAEFAADLRSYLADEPIRASEPSTWHRLAKFVRRHRAQSLGIAVVTFGLIGATAVLWWALATTNNALAESEKQKQEIERRADAGFRLLANRDRLIAAIAAAQQLPPPWPQNEQRYRDWLANHGKTLAEELPKLSTKLTELEGRELANDVDRHLYSALQRLEDSLSDFEENWLVRVREKLAFLENQVSPTLANHAADWERAITEIRREYAGLKLHPLPGLVPLGPNPKTGLQEFLDLATHDPATPIPERDPATGAPVAEDGTGLVFVLAPRDSFTIGAERDRPGLPRNDPDAAANELRGDRIQLDAFLIANSEMTRGQWARLNAKDEQPLNPRLPAAGIDWTTARRRLGEFDLDLPTEAQWEYACRAGTKTPWSADAIRLPDHARLASQSALPVGSLAPNPWGLFDCHGNVAEWCLDPLLDYATSSTRANTGLRVPSANAPEPTMTSDADRVIRGGAWNQPAKAGRSTARDAMPPDTRTSSIGVRPIRRFGRD
ncbi:MAG: bifunctional serine/threonine-protein kinase/formylglycine-generating enzyme family protein [bacterium]|nr:bifunctional serine/threonine-protein kinase/formylglycine-generating enzyme family protein [bacterium]